MYKMGTKNSVCQGGVLTWTPLKKCFNYVRTKLNEQFLNRNIALENFEEYSART